MKVLLKNATWMEGEEIRHADIRIDAGKIAAIGETLAPLRHERVLALQHHHLYCGLINAHDHLEMNLYPRLGSPPYHNYTEWARDIYKPKESPVREIEAIPIRHRLLWGGVKNLISGVTTVVHHNPRHYSLAFNFPVRVLRKVTWAHSVAFERNIKKKFPRDEATPFVIHAAEGIDSMAREEIGRLKTLGVLKSNTVLVHGVAISEEETKLVRDAGASVVWCPTSNYFMFNKTAPVSSLKRSVRIALGSDSTMTGPATFFDEMRCAINSGEATAREIVEMSTTVATAIFKLPPKKVTVGAPADLLILPKTGAEYYADLFQDSARLAGVFVGGVIKYAEPDMANELGVSGHLHPVNGREKWFAFDVGRLKERILRAGVSENLLEGNSLWTLLR